MVFGAVYVGQLPMKSMMCCLRRLRGPPQSFEEDNRQRLGGGRRSSVRIKRGKGSSSSNPSSTSLSIKIRPGTGIQHRDENSPEASSRGSSERVPFLLRVMRLLLCCPEHLLQRRALQCCPEHRLRHRALQALLYYFVVHLCQPGNAKCEGLRHRLGGPYQRYGEVNEGRLRNNTAKLGIPKRKGNAKVAH